MACRDRKAGRCGQSCEEEIDHALQIGRRVCVRLADGRRVRNATIADISATIQLSSENKLFSQDPTPERYAQPGIRLSEEFADAPGAAVETTTYRPLLRWLADIFRFWLAVRQGFEPWRLLLAYTLSRRAPSTTRPPHRFQQRSL